MPSFVRKIELSKWKKGDGLEEGDHSADAITSCLRTTNNTLSTWLINTEDELNDAILAIASQAQHIDTIDVIIIDETVLQNNNLQYIASNGITPYTDFVTKHYDIINLSYKTLGVVAKVVAESINIKAHTRRITKGTLKELLKNGLSSGKLEVGKIKNELLVKIQ